jgi:glutathione S-transferase
VILYHCHDARSFRPLWALEELGLDYELKMLPFPPRVLQRDYLAANPLGTIPLFLDGETRMTESAAIVEYLGAKFGAGGLGVTLDEPGYGAYLNGLHFGEATLTFPQTLVLRYSRLEPEERRSPQVAADYGKWFLARLGKLVIGENGYVAAGRFTGADISIGYALLLASQLGLNAQFAPQIADYWAKLQARDGYQRARAAQAKAAADQDVATVDLSAL